MQQPVRPSPALSHLAQRNPICVCFTFTPSLNRRVCWALLLPVSEGASRGRVGTASLLYSEDSLHSFSAHWAAICLNHRQSGASSNRDEGKAAPKAHRSFRPECLHAGSGFAVPRHEHDRRDSAQGAASPKIAQEFARSPSALKSLEGAPEERALSQGSSRPLRSNE